MDCKYKENILESTANSINLQDTFYATMEDRGLNSSQNSSF